jgi:hypothetical protein
MLKIETYNDVNKMATVWKLTISDYELAMLDFTPQEKVILDKCNEPSAQISMVALGLALIARKIEQKTSSAPNTASSGQWGAVAQLGDGG